MGTNGLLIGEIARRSGASRKALRLYEAAGILPEPSRTLSGYRVYDNGALELLSFVRVRQAVRPARHRPQRCAQIFDSWPDWIRSTRTFRATDPTIASPRSERRWQTRRVQKSSGFGTPRTRFAGRHLFAAFSTMH